LNLVEKEYLIFTADPRVSDSLGLPLWTCKPVASRDADGALVSINNISELTAKNNVRLLNHYEPLTLKLCGNSAPHYGRQSASETILQPCG
jgi:hypothetical protein